MAVKPNLPSGKGQSYKGEIGQDAKFAKPFEDVDGGVGGLDGTHNDIGELSGFQADASAYIVKKGTAFGESAKFNVMPPGMDINDQPTRDIRDMPMKFIVAESYPDDGWHPTPRDLSEGYGPKGSLA